MRLRRPSASSISTPPSQRFALDRAKAYVDQCAYFNGRNVLLVIGEYFWDGEVFPREAIWDMAVDRVPGARATTRPTKGIEIVLELEPFSEALVKDVDELVRFVRDVDLRRQGQRRHLAPAPVGRILRGREEADGA